MTDQHKGSTAGRSTAGRSATELQPLVLHPRSGIVILTLLLITLGLMIGPMVLHMVDAPLR